MGNSFCKLFCCHCQREEETPEEIPMQTLAVTADQNNETLNVQRVNSSVQTSDVDKEDSSAEASYVEMKEGKISSDSSEDVSSLEEDSTGCFRFRVVADHIAADNEKNVEHLQIIDISVPAELIQDIDKLQWLYHVSVYNNQRERIVDLTVIQDMGPTPTMKHVLYWKDPQENSWRFNFSHWSGQKLYKQYRVSPMENVLVWAATHHTQTDSEVIKMLLLSKGLGVIGVPSYIKESAGCVLHITSYNLQLVKNLDVILIQGKSADSQSECYVQVRNPQTERPLFNFSSLNSAEAFHNIFN